VATLTSVVESLVLPAEASATLRGGNAMAKHVLVVFTNPVEGRDDEYNKWYDEVHLADVLDVPGVVAARRLELSPLDAAGSAAAHRYLALYDVEGDPATVMKELNDRVANGTMALSDALDAQSVSLSIYTPRDQ
jgi:hypothetical protein